MKQINVTFNDLPYDVEEALNRLRINIKFCGKDTRRIIFTSSVPNEGKSIVTIQLWKLLAEAGFKTLYMDLDLRNSVTNARHTLGLTDKDFGIASYISGMSEYSDIVYSTNVPNGYIVPCTNLLENPSTLFEDARFEELLNQLSEDFRYIIIDSPPIINVADGAQIASLCDGAVLVVRAGFTSRTLIRQSMQQLEQVGCPLLGMVLNRVESKGRGYGKYSKYGKYYGKYYSQYYGGDDKKKGKK